MLVPPERKFNLSLIYGTGKIITPLLKQDSGNVPVNELDVASKPGNMRQSISPDRTIYT